MKRNLALFLLLGIVLASVPAHGFVDWLFGGSSNRGAVGNSVAGDLRSWWTGNPVYTFNPFYSGGQPQQQGGQAAPAMQYTPEQGAAMQYQQPGSAYPAPQQGTYGQYQQPMAGYPAPQGGYAQYQQPSPGAYQAQAAPNYGQTYSAPLQQPVQPSYSPTLPGAQPYQGGYQGYQGAPSR